MRAQDYPPQEPTSAMAAEYRDTCIARSFGIPFVEFCYDLNPYQSIAVYSAQNPTGEVLAFIHGGGWTSGYKEWMGFMAPALTAQGITFASIGYRLAPQYIFPAGLDDCAAAVRFLYEKAAVLGYDRERFFLGGHSAGGHYASLLAVRRDWQAQMNLPTDVLKGCLPISGVYRFGENSGLSMRPRFLGPEGNGAELTASPIRHIQGKPPPFFMACGEGDFPHLVRQANEMADELRAAGTITTLVVLPGRTHFTASLAGGDTHGPWVPGAVAFMRSL